MSGNVDDDGTESRLRSSDRLLVTSPPAKRRKRFAASRFVSLLVDWMDGKLSGTLKKQTNHALRMSLYWNCPGLWSERGVCCYCLDWDTDGIHSPGKINFVLVSIKSISFSGITTIQYGNIVALANRHLNYWGHPPSTSSSSSAPSWPLCVFVCVRKFDRVGLSWNLLLITLTCLRGRRSRAIKGE